MSRPGPRGARASQERMRARRAAEGKCRQCEEPRAVIERDGVTKLAQLCRTHLDADWKRKTDKLCVVCRDGTGCAICAVCALKADFGEEEATP